MSPKHTAGLTMNIPIFSGLQRDSKVKQAKITLEQSYMQKSLLQDQLNVQDEQLKFNLKTPWKITTCKKRTSMLPRGY